MPLPRAVVERLIFGPPDAARRFTQDSPILPDVWIALGERPTERHDLLLTPHRAVRPGLVAARLRADLTADRSRRGAGTPPAVAHVQAYVRSELDFPDLLRVVLPLTQWWRDYAWPRQRREEGSIQSLLRGALDDIAADLADFHSARPAPRRTDLEHDLLWTLRIAGAIAWARAADLAAPRPLPQPDPAAALGALVELLEGFEPPDVEPLVWLVNRNREVTLAIHRSVLAVKADAARQLFRIDCSGITWGVVDGGIDARHPAFGSPDGDPAKSRVAKTWDLTRIGDLLDPGKLTALPEPLQSRLDRAGAGARRELKKLRLRLLDGGEVDWDLLEPFLRVPHGDGYEPPASDHGTHVAGILAADWQRQDGRGKPDPLIGMCPDLKLFDLRVFSPDGPNDEFSVLAALQLVRHLNRQVDYRAVHGVNLSLSLLHDVANYACGRTPICEECERLVASGVVVVAAAGNAGYLRYLTEGGVTEGYHTVSISDPGNAEGVLTVGATHRFRPHTYGVSYFSSRGPTGDGRRKPDLVAPGEKILAPVGRDGADRKDGTSMAAPHVSGAAALLMARHSELEGDPVEVKRILCASATDLGREPYFQGRGMLDVLRALQSV